MNNKAHDLIYGCYAPLKCMVCVIICGYVFMLWVYLRSLLSSLMNFTRSIFWDYSCKCDFIKLSKFCIVFIIYICTLRWLRIQFFRSTSVCLYQMDWNYDQLSYFAANYNKLNGMKFILQLVINTRKELTQNSRILLRIQRLNLTTCMVNFELFSPSENNEISWYLL